MCCETEDPENIKAFMDAADIKPVKKCLNICYDLQGAIYEIPNYCLNQPALFEVKAKDTNKPDEKYLNVRNSLNLSWEYEIWIMNSY